MPIRQILSHNQNSHAHICLLYTWSVCIQCLEHMLRTANFAHLYTTMMTTTKNCKSIRTLKRIVLETTKRKKFNVLSVSASSALCHNESRSTFENLLGFGLEVPNQRPTLT